MLKGYRTIIVNVLAIVYVVLASSGVDIPAPEQETISAGIIAIANVVMRFITDTKVGESA